MAESEGQTGPAPAEGDDATEGADETGAPDARIAQSMDRLSDRLDTFMDSVKPAEDAGIYDLTADDLYGDDDEGGDDFAYEDEGQAAQAQPGDTTDEDVASKILDEYVGTQIQEKLDPFFAQQYESQRQAQLEGLEQKYPELQKQDVAAPVLEKAQELAVAVGQPGLAYEAPFLETVYLRSKAEGQLAAENQAAAKADGSETHIETAGAAASGSEGDTDLADEIVKAGKPRSFLVG